VSADPRHGLDGQIVAGVIGGRALDDLVAPKRPVGTAVDSERATGAARAYDDRHIRFT